MSRDSLRSFVCRSFGTCDDPKGVVECRTIRRSETGSECRRNAKNKSNTKDRLFEISRRAHELNHVTDPCSGGLWYDGNSKDAAKDLLRGALDLQDSLHMLGKLHMAKLKKKEKEQWDRVRNDQVIRRTDSSPVGERSYRCLSVDCSSRDCIEELREVVRDSLEMRCLQNHCRHFRKELKRCFKGLLKSNFVKEIKYDPHQWSDFFSEQKLINYSPPIVLIKPRLDLCLQPHENLSMSKDEAKVTPPKSNVRKKIQAKKEKTVGKAATTANITTEKLAYRRDGIVSDGRKIDVISGNDMVLEGKIVDLASENDNVSEEYNIESADQIPTKKGTKHTDILIEGYPGEGSVCDVTCYSELAGENYRTSSLYSMVERDMKHKEVLSGVWDLGWRNGFSLDDDEPTEKNVSTSRYSKFDLGQYPDFDLGQYSDFDDVSKEETDPACNDFDIDQYPNFDDETAAADEDVVDDNEEEVTTVNEHVEHLFCNSYNPEEEKKEEEIPEEKSPKKMPREYNWNMPELLQIPEEELVKIAVDCYPKIIRIKKDDCFDTKEDLKIDLYTECVEDGYKLKVNQSSKDHFETRVYRGHEIMTDMNAQFKISISYSQAWRAKCYALELLRGSPEASFAQLPAYCHNLKLKNPGSVTHIKTDRDGRFELLFIAIGAAIRSFITCMRPVIIVDGAHLKGRYLGVNLLAVAMDANNGILPIAYGVGKSETSDSWIWFMGHLRDCIGPISNLTIISDRVISIDNVVRRCFPDAFHGLCGVHLYRNLKSRSAGIKNHKWTYWKVVKAYREVDFNKHINYLRRVLPQCAQTLEDVRFERWSRVHQLGAKYGFMTSNSAESINALSRHSRKLPITMFMEFFRASIQQWNIGTSCYTMD
ncbi:hypothetical protein F3Y22_tig00117048pilonHSYRG01337 [Hibiscus syriacus]|uniref:MULE transposase domain-containing protein n=1 Tax=Hibiscus syriacus TaxID=106335 RepID=A0A6A2WEZ5_HIBSY|nr:hypothetical protein F3Y22_tig00117048pilonHSYRG01337 [Hibiscus syriacus]